MTSSGVERVALMAVSDPDRSVRKEARGTLDTLLKHGTTFSPLALTVSQEAVRDPVFVFRSASHRVAGVCVRNNPELVENAFPSLKVGLVDDHWDVRRAALIALSDVVDVAPRLGPEVLDLTRIGLHDNKMDVQDAALQTLDHVVKRCPQLAGVVADLTEPFVSSGRMRLRVTALRTLSQAANADPMLTSRLRAAALNAQMGTDSDDVLAMTRSILGSRTQLMPANSGLRPH